MTRPSDEPFFCFLNSRSWYGPIIPVGLRQLLCAGLKISTNSPAFLQLAICYVKQPSGNWGYVAKVTSLVIRHACNQPADFWEKKQIPALSPYWIRTINFTTKTVRSPGISDCSMLSISSILGVLTFRD
jgi:hypothetical protein